MAKATRSTLLCALLACGLASPPAAALRCGTRLVSTGDSKPRVWETCGEPQFREVIRDHSRWGNDIVEERWYYPKRTGRLRPVVIFDNDGRVSEIRTEH